MITYEEAKEKEVSILKYLEEEVKNEGYEIVEIDRYSSADLVIKKDNLYECIEVKSRTGKYDLNYFNRNGMYVETGKLKRLHNYYKVNQMQLITITSDGYILTGMVNFLTEKRTALAAKTSSFKDREKIRKEFYVVKGFEIKNSKFTSLILGDFNEKLRMQKTGQAYEGYLGNVKSETFEVGSIKEEIKGRPEIPQPVQGIELTLEQQEERRLLMKRLGLQ